DRAPVVIVPATPTASEADAFTLTVHAADPDGQPLASLTADLSGLPAGNSATFIPDLGDTTGTLFWTPAYDDAGSYTVTFIAANVVSGSTTTKITVINLDRAPSIAAPLAAAVAETQQVSVTLHAADADGEAIQFLIADLTNLPPGNHATFTVDPGDTTATLEWTPDYDAAGSYEVTFFASNGMSATAGTIITVSNTDRAPLV